MRHGHRCLVVGGGLLGLCAADALSQRGWSVEVLEAGPRIGHEGAGSKGGARIFRLGYPQRNYVEMAVRAAAGWRRLEGTTGRRLLVPTGQLSLGDRSSLSAIEGALAAHGVRYEEWSAGEARERFPTIAAGDGPVLFEPTSGVLVADECLRALCDAGHFTVRAGVTVTAIYDDKAEAVRVRTARGEHFGADVVVDCAGPAALALLPDSVATDVSAAASMPQVAYFRSAAKPPVFIEWGAEMLYGLPVPAPGPDGEMLYKVSRHSPGPPVPHYDPTGTGTIPDDPSLLATLTHAVRRLLPSLDPEPVRTERCVYDNTTDGHFVLDRTGRVVVGCGTSGHGFKFGPLLGEALADLAEGVAPSIDLTPFRLARPARFSGPSAR